MAFSGCPQLRHIVLLLSRPYPSFSGFNKNLKKINFSGTVYGLSNILDSIEVEGINKEYLLGLDVKKRMFYGFDFSFKDVSSIIDNGYEFENHTRWISVGEGYALEWNEIKDNYWQNGAYSFYNKNEFLPGKTYSVLCNVLFDEITYPLYLDIATAGIDIATTEVSSSSLSFEASYSDGNFTVLEAGFYEYESDSTNLILTGLDPNSSYTVEYYVTTEEEGTISKTFTSKTDTLHFSTLPAKATSNTVALICAETNLSDMETGAGFEWRRYDAPDLVPSTKSPCPVVDGVLTGALRNLSAGTYYKFRPYYTSASGQTYYGDWLAFGTADAYVYFEPTVRTYAATDVTETEARVRGYAIAGSDDITEQGFEYWSEGAPAKRSATNVQRVQTEGQFMTATLVDLLPGTTYTFRVYVETAKGTTYGEEQTFTTVDDGTGIFGIGSDGEAEGLEVAVRGNLSAGGTFVKVSGNGGEARWTLTAVGGATVAQGRVVADGSWQRLEGVRASLGIYLLTVSDGQVAKTIKLAVR